MATKYFCDKCESEAKSLFRFEYYIHLHNLSDMRGYVDGEGNPISGRTVCADLCIKCYNKVVSKAVTALQKES